MKNKIIIVFLLSLSVFALGSFLMSGLMDNQSGAYVWSDNDNQSSNDIISASVNVSKSTKRANRSPVANSSFSSLKGVSADKVGASSISSSRFSSLSNQRNHSSINSEAIQGNYNLGFSAFHNNKSSSSNLLAYSSSNNNYYRGGGSFRAPGASTNLLIDPMTDPNVKNRISSGSTILIDPMTDPNRKDRISDGTILIDPMTDPNTKDRISDGTILIDPMTDPNKDNRIPIGNANWILVLLAGLYAGRKFLK